MGPPRKKVFACEFLLFLNYLEPAWWSLVGIPKKAFCLEIQNINILITMQGHQTNKGSLNL